jgi:hypothetical protein
MPEALSQSAAIHYTGERLQAYELPKLLAVNKSNTASTANQVKG